MSPRPTPPRSTVAVYITSHPQLRAEGRDRRARHDCAAAGVSPEQPGADQPGSFTLPARPSPVSAARAVSSMSTWSPTRRHTVVEANYANDIGPAQPVKVSLASAALPELQATEPGACRLTLSPGDTIHADHLHRQSTARRPSANTGAGRPRRLHHAQLHRRQLDHRPVQHPRQHPKARLGGLRRRHDRRVQLVTLNPLDNVFTFTAPAVTLPTSPSTYFLGLVVDPNGQIHAAQPAEELAGRADPCRRPIDLGLAAGRGRVDGQ